jgi:hypothetical protein
VAKRARSGEKRESSWLQQLPSMKPLDELWPKPRIGACAQSALNIATIEQLLCYSQSTSLPH